MSPRTLLLSLAFLSIPLSSIEAADIYAIARLSYNSSPFNRYQYGSINVDTPNTSGGAGNFVYTFSPIGAESSTALANLAMNTTNSTMYVINAFNTYRTIDIAGNLSASLGTTSASGGMTFDNSGNVYSLNSSSNAMLNLNPATGATVSSSSTSGGSLYSSFGGNMAWAGGQYYFANQNGYNLVTIGTTGQITTIGAFSGTGYLGSSANNLFMHLNQMYMLNGLNLYTVNLSNGVLTKLGSVTGVLGDNPSQGFSGAVSPTPVPEPSTIVLAIAAGVLALASRRFGRYNGRG